MMKRQRTRDKLPAGRGKLRRNPLVGRNSPRTFSRYDALVAALLKRPFPTLWTLEDFRREFGVKRNIAEPLRRAGVWRSDDLWITDPVTKKRTVFWVWRLLRTKLPAHLRTRSDLRREHERQWNYVGEHRECIERLQQMTRYLAQIAA